MTLKAGQNIRFDVKITGEPPPSKSWFLNKARLDSRDDISIDNEDYKTKLVIIPVSRKHSGTYVIKAENSSGKDEVSVEVTVLGMFISSKTPLSLPPPSPLLSTSPLSMSLSFSPPPQSLTSLLLLFLLHIPSQLHICVSRNYDFRSMCPLHLLKSLP
jgi:hypothetical protein